MQNSNFVFDKEKKKKHGLQNFLPSKSMVLPKRVFDKKHGKGMGSQTNP